MKCEYRDCTREAKGIVFDDRDEPVKCCRPCAGPDGFDAPLKS